MTTTAEVAASKSKLSKIWVKPAIGKRKYLTIIDMIVDMKRNLQRISSWYFIGISGTAVQNYQEY